MVAVLKKCDNEKSRGANLQDSVTSGTRNGKMTHLRLNYRAVYDESGCAYTS